MYKPAADPGGRVFASREGSLGGVGHGAGDDVCRNGDWQRLLGPLEANGEDLAHLQVLRAKLETMASQAVRLTAEQAALTAAKQEASQQLRALLPMGRRLATTLWSTRTGCRR